MLASQAITGLNGACPMPSFLSKRKKRPAHCVQASLRCIPPLQHSFLMWHVLSTFPASHDASQPSHYPTASLNPCSGRLLHLPQAQATSSVIYASPGAASLRLYAWLYPQHAALNFTGHFFLSKFIVNAHIGSYFTNKGKRYSS